MDDSRLVCHMDSPGQEHRELSRLPRGLGRAGEAITEAAPFEQFERDERLTACFADVVDLKDVGMPDPRDRLGLGAEASDEIRAGRAAAADHL